jgi:hypothetical protein
MSEAPAKEKAEVPSAEVVTKIPAKTWAYLLVYTVVLTAVITLETHFLPAAWGTGGINIGPSGLLLAAIALPYVFSFMMFLLIKYAGLKVSKVNFALFYIATMIATWFSVFKGFYTTPASLFNVRVATAEVHSYALPYFWMPSAEAIRGAYYRGSLNNLFVTYASEWMPVILNYIYWYIVSILFFIGWAIILRRLWVDIEVLPFPHAQGWVTAEIALAAQEGKSDRRMKVFMATTLFGIIFYIPYMIYSAYPGFPDFYGWLKGAWFTTWSTGHYELTHAFPVIANSVSNMIGISTDPLRYAYFFIIPLDSLLSMTVAIFGVTIILPQILSYFGYYSGIYEYTTWCGWTKWGMIYYGDPLYLKLVQHGMIVGILIFMILINWKYFLNTIKQAISRKTPATEVSYGLGYLFVLLGAIGLVALFMATGVEFLDSLGGLFIIFMITVVLARVRSYAAHILQVTGEVYFKPFWGPTMPPAPEFPAGKLFIGTHVCRWGVGTDTYGPYYVSLMGTMDGFKIGSMSGVHPNLVFRLCLIGAIISAIIVIPLTFIIWHAYGFMELPVAKEWDYFWEGDSGTYNGLPGIQHPAGIAGIILAGVLVFLRTRYLWWPIEPLGFALGLDDWMPWSGTFVPLIVWIVKYAVIKFGGRRLYDEVGVPAAFGIITGEMIGIILVSAINIFRFVVFGAA